MTDSQIKSNDAQYIIGQCKLQILQKIWDDSYLHAMITDGVITEIIIDKDTYDVSDLPKDRQYFVIAITTIPFLETFSQKATKILEEMTYIVKKYYMVNDLPLASPEDQVYWISVPILY